MMQKLDDQSKHEMTARIVLWPLTAALAGFIFGFDAVVISGAKQKIQALWNLSPAMHGIAIASVLYGTVLGALMGGWPTDRYGRKPVLLVRWYAYVAGYD